MEIPFHLFLFTFGLAWLAISSEALISGSVAAAHRLRVRPLVIGLTVVAYGTSAPEVVVSVLAAYDGQGDISLGNVIGSNIANIGLILAIAALILPIDARASLFKFHFPFLLLTTCALWLVVLGKSLERWEGIILIATAVVFTYLSYKLMSGPADTDSPAEVNGAELDQGKRLYRVRPPILLPCLLLGLAGVARLTWWVLANSQSGHRMAITAAVSGGFALVVGVILAVLWRAHRRETDAGAPDAVRGVHLPSWFLLAFGLIGLAGGAQIMVGSAVEIAEAFGVSKVVIGLTLIAIGTSLPELAACIAASLRGAHEISLGNVIGSNVFNVCVVIGLIALLVPFDIVKIPGLYDNLVYRQLPIMTAFTVILIPMFLLGKRLSRLDGAFLLAGYIGFMAYTVVGSSSL